MGQTKCHTAKCESKEAAKHWQPLFYCNKIIRFKTQFGNTRLSFVLNFSIPRTEGWGNRASKIPLYWGYTLFLYNSFYLLLNSSSTGVAIQLTSV